MKLTINSAVFNSSPVLKSLKTRVMEKKISESRFNNIILHAREHIRYKLENIGIVISKRELDNKVREYLQDYRVIGNE